MSEAVVNPENEAESIAEFTRPGDGENVIQGEIPDAASMALGH